MLLRLLTSHASAARCRPDSCSISLCRLLPCASIVTIAGKSLTEDVAKQAGEAAVAGASPLSQNAYKVQLAKVAVKRALMAAAGAKA